MKVNSFYKVNYIPNKWVYVTKIDSQIHFYAFFNEGSGIKPVLHSVSKRSLKDFTQVNTSPIKPILDMVKNIQNEKD